MDDERRQRLVGRVGCADLPYHSGMEAKGGETGYSVDLLMAGAVARAPFAQPDVTANLGGVA
jgi:hypothetical protein